MLLFNQAFAKRVRELMKEKNMTQYKLEQETGIYHSTMSTILHQHTKGCRSRNMAIIIRALGVSLSEFFDSPLFDYNNLEIE